MIAIAVVAGVLFWVIDAHRRNLADDRHSFYTHEERAAYLAFLRSVAVAEAEEADWQAAAGGNDRAHWIQEASRRRRRVAEIQRSEDDYRWRAELKRRGY